MSENETADVISFISSYLGDINGTLLAKFKVLIDRKSSIYMKVTQKALALVMLLPLKSFCINSHNRIGRDRDGRGTVCSERNGDYFLNNVHSELRS